METDEPGLIQLRMTSKSTPSGASTEENIGPIHIQEMYDPGWHIRGPAASEWQVARDSVTGMITLMPLPGAGPGLVELAYRPRHWRLALWALTIGGLFSMGWWLKETTRLSSKKEKKLFSSPDAPE